MTDKDMPDLIYATDTIRMGSWNIGTVNGKHRQVPESEYLKSTPARKAAPELLEALRDASELAHWLSFSDSKIVSDWARKVEEKANAAIAKARGQS